MQEFRCRYCGDYFTLSKEDQELFDEGFLDHEPDTCDDCYSYNASCENGIDDSFDSDTGL